jgi:hypothetical protein
MRTTDPMETTFYQRLIAVRTRDLDPRHVEAWMRLEHPTLDGFSRVDFEREVDIAVIAIANAGADESEALAASFGLWEHEGA